MLEAQVRLIGDFLSGASRRSVPPDAWPRPERVPRFLGGAQAFQCSPGGEERSAGTGGDGRRWEGTAGAEGGRPMLKGSGRRRGGRPALKGSGRRRGGSTRADLRP